ncbi:uncharacterized protein LOC135483808 [Lineus longissimus]|uniref:uncharacterized protein LOC135483808 n=1 Tax=Lineus longissimus TaxID=88925 RepID=UPI002B4F3638
MRFTIIVAIAAGIAGCCQAGPPILPPGTREPPKTTCKGTPTGESEQEFQLDEKWSEIRDAVFPHTCQCRIASDLYWRASDNAISFCQLQGCRAYTDSGEEFVPPNENQHGCNCTPGGGPRIADAPSYLYGCGAGFFEEVITSEEQEEEETVKD